MEPEDEPKRYGVADTTDIAVALYSEANQENCDGPEYDLMQAAAHYIRKLEKRPETVCCKGCPDCVGIGVREQLKGDMLEIKELKEEIERLKEKDNASS
jgi:hypothetical protein